MDGVPTFTYLALHDPHDRDYHFPIPCRRWHTVEFVNLAPQSITTLDVKNGEVSHRLPALLPGGKSVIFTVTHNALPRWGDARLAVVSLATGERRDLGQGADARYVPTGHIVFMKAGTLVAAPFDLTRLTLTGGTVSLVSDVMQAGRTLTAFIDTGAGQFTTSSSGTNARAKRVLPDSTAAEYVLGNVLCHDAAHTHSEPGAVSSTTRFSSGSSRWQPRQSADGQPTICGIEL
jgi:hypothetical protein